jgi:hypothetical protein
MEPSLIDLERGDLAGQGLQPVLLGHHALLQVGGGGEDLLQHLRGVIRGEGGGHGGRVGWVVVHGGKGGRDDHKRKKPGSEYQVVAYQGLYSNNMRELQGSRWLWEVNSPSPRLSKFFSAVSWRIPPLFYRRQESKPFQNTLIPLPNLIDIPAAYSF